MREAIRQMLLTLAIKISQHNHYGIKNKKHDRVFVPKCMQHFQLKLDYIFASSITFSLKYYNKEVLYISRSMLKSIRIWYSEDAKVSLPQRVILYKSCLSRSVVGELKILSYTVQYSFQIVFHKIISSFISVANCEIQRD